MNATQQDKKLFEFSVNGKVLKVEHKNKTTCYKLDMSFSLSENMTEITREEYNMIYRQCGIDDVIEFKGVMKQPNIPSLEYWDWKFWNWGK